ncbi:hypothetical protein V8J88_01850 [Massilia sp. W12]|uniref:hypothetical protein n=1 Tax=Massilia sp. W12 TaxID=3126507 RepID=UPI0030CE6967
MKKTLLLCAAVLTLASCSMWPGKKVSLDEPVKPPVKRADAPDENFVAGVSSVTVENMAKKVGCTGGPGAARVSDKGPVEIYRMQCSNGQVFQARCELRQCKQI